MPSISPKHPAAELIRAAFKGAIARMQAADPDARRGEPEGVHRLRTATRRLRSELLAVAELVDQKWGEHLEQELKWLASELGSVRDLDILCQRLRAALPSVASNGQSSGSPCKTGTDGPLGPLFLALRDRHGENLQRLRDDLQGRRYSDLMTRLANAAESPCLRDEASEPCRKILPPLAATAWRHLKKGGRGLDEDSPDADFHHVRKLAKRARYTAELIAPALGQSKNKCAKRFVRLTTQIQDILGEHQDAIVATAELRRFQSEHPRDHELVRQIHDLLKTQHDAVLTTRAKFFDIWNKLDRKKSLRWFKRKKHRASAS